MDRSTKADRLIERARMILDTRTCDDSGGIGAVRMGANVITKTLSACGIVALLLLVNPSAATACDCVRVDPATPQFSGLIIYGRAINLSLDTGTGTMTVTLEVIELLNGSYPKKTITLYGFQFGWSCDGYNFQLAREYIVFPSMRKPGSSYKPSFVVPDGAYVFGGLCGPTEDLQTPRGQQKLKEIREYFKTK